MRRLRVTFSKANSGEEYAEIARGTWVLGCEPVLSGEAIPPEVLKGLEAQACATPACAGDDARGTLIYDRSDVRYALDFEVIN
jgi:hypothetical protein